MREKRLRFAYRPIVDSLTRETKLHECLLRSAQPDGQVVVAGLTTASRFWMRSAVAMLRGRPDIAERMVVEITETAGLEDLEACCRFV